MDLKNRFQRIIKQPDLRIKYCFFIFIGLLLFLSSFFLSEPLKNLLINFSVTFFAIALIKILWDFLGGDPLEDEFKSLRCDIHSCLDEVLVQSKLINDLFKFNLGIKRFWPSRRAWRKDVDSGFEKWRSFIFQSKEIAVLSITFWNNWMEDSDFREGLKKTIENSAKVRIIVYEPGSQIQKIRAKVEKDLNGEMVAEIQKTVKFITEIKQSLPESIKDLLEIRYTGESHHFVQILQADDKMLVGFYLHGKDGFSSPTVYIKGKETTMFSTYYKQFELLWQTGKKI